MAYYSVWYMYGKVKDLVVANINSADKARLIAINYTTEGSPAYIEENGKLKYIVVQRLKPGKIGNSNNDYVFICVTVVDFYNRKKDKVAYISKKTGKLYR